VSVRGCQPEARGQGVQQRRRGILGEAGIIIALGSMLGALMAESGAADRIASTLLGLGKGKSLPWVMALVAMVIGLPLFLKWVW
jgi:GntP family gluconate:H+ symporter